MPRSAARWGLGGRDSALRCRYGSPPLPHTVLVLLRAKMSLPATLHLDAKATRRLGLVSASPASFLTLRGCVLHYAV